MKLKRRPFWFYFGPAVLVSVGYMDPGNWATSLEAGSRYGYGLLWIVTLSSAMAMLVQVLAAKLGIATGRDLAQLMRERYQKRTRYLLLGSAVVAMMATDLAEFLGVAIALNLLFGIPLLVALLLTFIDVLLILWLGHHSYRWVESFILVFVATIGIVYLLEIFLSHPNPSTVAFRAFVPDATIFSGNALFIAIGILGATIMPHNLFLHSSSVLTRLGANQENRKRILRLNVIDTVISLGVAWLINGAILVMAAATFFGGTDIVSDISQAYLTLKPLLGNAAATAFGVGLLASGLASSTTGTLAGQIVLEGFFGRAHINRVSLRLLTRLATMLPAMLAILLSVRPLSLLVLSQVILSLQLPFTLVPLVRFSADKRLMGALVNRPAMNYLAWLIAGFIILLNISLLIQLIIP